MRRWPNRSTVLAHLPGRKASGVTLVEMMVAMAILAILAALAAPSFTELVASQRGKAAASTLHAMLLKARSEAIKRNADVTLAPLASDGWEQGWRILDPSLPSRALDRQGALKGATISGPASVVYQPSGRIAGGAPEFDIAIQGSAAHRCVSVDLGGRPQVKASSC